MTKKIFHHPVIVIGAGLAGLSAAFHLKRKDIFLIEKFASAGGLARSFHIGPFTFDFTGHLLHLHFKSTKKLIKQLLRGNMALRTRKAAIHMNGVDTPYPFQANTKGLPNSVVDDCVLQFFEAAQKKPLSATEIKRLNFRDWCIHTFGRGIARHFMIPYNEKLYQTKASKMTTEWVGPFVPRPALEDVLRGALKDPVKQFGYNTKFYYPMRGGIQALPNALAKRVPPIQYGTPAVNVDFKKKTIVLSDRTTHSYDVLINTAPLPDLIRLAPEAPQRIREWGRKLASADILCLNVGVNRAKISDKSWIYFPEPTFPFYRVGFPANFSSHVAPKNASSMYIEIPKSAAKGKTKKALLLEVRLALLSAGILKPSDRFTAVQFLPIKNAYVIYNRVRDRVLPKIFSFLSAHQVYSIGRYGGWKYSFMEEAILDGEKAAASILKTYPKLFRAKS